MRQVIHQAPIYEHVLESYEAETYVKGRTHVPRKNKLLQYAYLVFPIERHPRDAFFEMSGLTRYDAPNHYRNKIVAINSSHLAAGRHYKEIASFVNLNVYSPTIYNKGMIMPLSPDAFKYYTFRQEGTDTISGIPVYNIRFTPRQWSQKLLYGNLYVTDELWTIDRIEIQGHSSFSEFNLSIRFNRDEKHFILPEEADLQVCYHALGNRIESDIHAAFRYKSISWVEEDHESRKLYSLDQTQYYTITSDTLSFTQDSAYSEQPEGQAAHYRRESLVHHRNERGEDGSGQQRSHPLPPTRRAAHQHGQQGLQEYSREVFRPSQPVPAIFRKQRDHL